MLSSNAAVTMVENTPGNYTVDMDPVTFTATGSSWVNAFRFKIVDFFDTNTNSNGSFTSGTIDISINGGATINVPGTGVTGTFGSLDQNDFFVQSQNPPGGALNPAPFVAGDTVVVGLTGFTFNSEAGLTAADGPRNIFLIENFDEVSSPTQVTVGAVPEPSSAVLSLLGLAGLALRRSRS